MKPTNEPTNKWTQKQIEKAMSYRTAKIVATYRIFPDHRFGVQTFALCPTCNGDVDRDYQAFCDGCGQKLKWISFRKMVAVNGLDDEEDEQWFLSKKEGGIVIVALF